MDIFSALSPKFYKIDTNRFPVWGIDTSFYSAQMDWDTFKKAGGTFAIIKMLGGIKVDVWFEKNYVSAKKAGVLVSTYQWLYSNALESVVLQASKYAEMLKQYPVDFYPSIDYEWYPSRNPVSTDLEKYVEEFESRSNYKLMIYSAPGYLRDNNYKLGNKFSSYPLWVAHYEVSNPDVVEPFTHWTFWQASERADGKSLGSSVYGETEIDLNYFNGSLSDFFELCNVSGGTDVKKIPSNPDTEIILDGKKYSVNTDVLNLRPEPNTSKPAIKKLYMGEILHGITKNVDGSWVKVLTSESLVGWCSIQYLRLISENHEEPKEEYNSPVNTTSVLESRNLFGGKADYKKWSIATPRGNIIYHIVKIKKQYAEIFITPRPSSVSYVHSFLTRYKLQIAINGDGFASVKKGSQWQLIMAGQSASKGQPYGTANAEGAIYISRNGEASFSRPPEKDLWNAIAFPNKLVENGTKAKITRTDLDPRTALGFTKDSDIIIVAVDGKETYNLNRSGASFDELATVLIENGAWIGVNLDGGGSTTLVIEGENKTPEILNVPCGENSINVGGKVYRLRPVANHFGVYIK
jgi:GH25 family lysozyme M1 (1,4-beta-N-acetylmuramidase)